MADKIIRVLAKDAPVKASAITAKEMVERARQIHKTLPVATAALGRSLMAASMMGNQLKEKDGSVTLRIKGGGPLGGIARRYGTTVTNICRLNGIKSTTVLRIGRSLRVR